jgi:hypothetical protein
MTPFILRHLFESTLFCLLLSLLACCLRNTATANVRHAVWLTGISKFAVPSVLLAKTGAAIAFLWPAASWLSSIANQIQAALLALLALLPASVVAGDQVVYHCIFIVWLLGAAALFAAWFMRLCHSTHAALRLPANQEHAALLHGRQGFQALDIAIDPNADLLVENFVKDHQVTFPVGWARLEQMMTYIEFQDRPVVPQLILIDRDGFIHYQTPRLGDPESMKEDVITKRIEELLKR